VPSQPFDYRARLTRATAAMAASGADTLLIAHLPNLRYLSGLEATAGLGLLGADGRLDLLVDPRYEAAAGACARAVGDDRIRVVATGDDRPTRAVAAQCLRQRVRHLAVESRAISWHDARQLERALSADGWHGVLDDAPSDLVEQLRRVKDPTELAILRHAGARLSHAARGVLADAVARPGRTEMEVAAEIDGRLRAVGFSRPAFDTIVASGPRSAMPHARPSARVLQADEVVVLDFGGVYGGYCVDLTRTVCLGRPTPDVNAQYHAVLAAQRAGCAAVAPGALPADVDRAARQVLEAAGLGSAFGHGTGHGLGLEVHEAPRLARLRPGDPLQPALAVGVVCTIEPGAYVAGRAGVRIEDDVVVTAAGHDRLTDVPLGWPTAH